MSPSYLGSSCSLFGCTFLAQCLGRLWIHICVFFGAVPGLVVDMFVCVCDRALVRQRRKLCVRSCIPRSCRCPWFPGRADSLVRVWRRHSSHTDAVYPHVFLDKVVDMPFVNDRLLHTGGASLQFIAFFRGHSSCAAWTGMVLPAVFLMAAMMGF